MLRSISTACLAVCIITVALNGCHPMILAGDEPSPVKSKDSSIKWNKVTSKGGLFTVELPSSVTIKANSINIYPLPVHSHAIVAKALTKSSLLPRSRSSSRRGKRTTRKRPPDLPTHFQGCQDGKRLALRRVDGGDTTEEGKDSATREGDPS